MASYGSNPKPSAQGRVRLRFQRLAFLLLGLVVAAGTGCGQNPSPADRRNHSVDFTGQGQYVVFLKPRPNRFEDWTLELWMKPEAWDRQGNQLVAQMKDENVGYHVLELRRGSLRAFGQHNALVAGSGNRFRPSLQVPVQHLTGWHHVAVVHETTGRSRARVTLFLDGRQADSQTLDAIPLVEHLRLGEHPNRKRSFQGHLDELRLWKMARTGSQITGWMRGIPETFPDELVGYWDFNRGEGVVALNNVDGWEGILHGDPQWSRDTPF